MFDDFFAIVIIGAGIYVLYAARELKQAHHIITTVISVPEGKTCKDMDGLVRYMFPRMMMLACVTCLLGAYELVVNYTSMSGMAFSVLELVLYVAFFGVMVYYFVCVKRLAQMFY